MDFDVMRVNLLAERGALKRDLLNLPPRLMSGETFGFTGKWS
jgi:hypothetical protein